MAHQRDDRGLTLIELSIAFLMMAILMTVVISATSHLVSDSANAQERVSLASEEQLVLDNLSRVIRAATPVGVSSDPVEYADASEITLYANLSAANSGTGPVKVEYKLVGTDLEETTWTAVAGQGGAWTYPGNGGTHTIATDVDSSHGALFAYYDLNGNALAVPMTQGGVPDTAPIASVRIDLWLGPGGAGGTQQAIEDATTVQLLNVDYVNGVQ